MTWAAYRSKDGRVVVHLAGYRVKLTPRAAKLFATAILLVVAEGSPRTR